MLSNFTNEEIREIGKLHIAKELKVRIKINEELIGSVVLKQMLLTNNQICSSTGSEGEADPSEITQQTNQSEKKESKLGGSRRKLPCCGVKLLDMEPALLSWAKANKTSLSALSKNMGRCPTFLINSIKRAHTKNENYELTMKDYNTLRLITGINFEERKFEGSFEVFEAEKVQFLMGLKLYTIPEAKSWMREHNVSSENAIDRLRGINHEVPYKKRLSPNIFQSLVKDLGL